MRDLYADLAATAVQVGPSSFVHGGMLASTYNFISTAASQLIIALQSHPTCSVLVCGHSLGAAVAALFAYLLTATRDTLRLFDLRLKSSFAAVPSQLDELRNAMIQHPLQCTLFAPAACVSEDISSSLRGIVTSVVLDRDAVPRLNARNVHEFVGFARTIDVTAAIKSSLVSSFADGVCRLLASKPMRSVQTKLESSSLNIQDEFNIPANSVAMSGKKLLDAARSQLTEVRRHDDEFRGREKAEAADRGNVSEVANPFPALMVPGRTMVLRKTSAGVALVEVNGVQFCERLYIEGKGLKHHRLKKYRRYLDKLLSQWTVFDGISPR